MLESNKKNGNPPIMPLHAHARTHARKNTHANAHTHTNKTHAHTPINTHTHTHLTCRRTFTRLTCLRLSGSIMIALALSAERNIRHQTHHNSADSFLGIIFNSHSHFRRLVLCTYVRLTMRIDTISTLSVSARLCRHI